MPAPTQIFISYARKDGRELALRLQADLQNAGLSAWLDTNEIDGGASWSSDIEQAIEDCDVTLTLLSRASFISEICRAEQLRALRKGKRVIPLLVQPDADRPLHLEHLNYRDFTDTTQFDEQFVTLLTDIREGKATNLPTNRQQTPNNAPKLPENFVARLEELTALRRAVMGDDTDRKVALTALRGMGGIGKSVMATALCHDEIVQAAFPDGIIWLTIGRTPGSLAETMKILGTALGDSAAHYDTEATGTSRLRDLLPHKSALIVLDDAWDSKHIEPFLADAPRCRFLFTTRDGSIALALGAGEIRLDVMKPAQAVELLRDWARRDDEALPEIADRLGYLPLALKLAGARLREGIIGVDWLNTFQHVSQIKLGRRSTDANDNLQVCFDLSTNQLVEADRSLYFTLGVFPEDVWIPQVVVTRLWRKLDSALTDFDCKEILTDLARLALIERRADDGAFTLHDLLHDYTREKLAGQRIPTHHTLLSAYNPAPEKSWHETADSYLCDYLVYHLIQAERADDLSALFANHDWMHKRFEQSGYTYIGFLDDLTQAWEIAHVEALRQIDADQEPTIIAQCIRYALIQTSINSIAANYPPKLIGLALEAELWTSERALAMAEIVPNAEHKANVYLYILIYGKLSNNQRIDTQKAALEAALNITDRYRKLEMLILLAERMDEEIKTNLLIVSLRAAMDIGDKNSRADFLLRLAQKFDEEQRIQILSQALAAAKMIESNSKRKKTLARVANHMKPNTVLKDLKPSQSQINNINRDLLSRDLNAVNAIKDKASQERALLTLALHMDDELLIQKLESLKSIGHKYWKSRVLIRLADFKQGDQKREILKEALIAANMIQTKSTRAQTLAVLAGNMEGSQKAKILNQSLKIALEIKSTPNQVRVLAKLVIMLEDDQKIDLLTNVVRAVRTTHDEYWRANMLSKLLPASEKPAPLIHDIRLALCTHIMNIKINKRKDLHYLIAEESIFTPPIFSPNTLDQIAEHVMDVCNNWRWQ
ncbi:MAG: TIR domain-containing protein [Anaerolineae bacterium]|nr:TIR domain-containing protein [Anaerolineae bacterium]